VIRRGLLRDAQGSTVRMPAGGHMPPARRTRVEQVQIARDNAARICTNAPNSCSAAAAKERGVIPPAKLYKLCLRLSGAASEIMRELRWPVK
jgi:hypothetical protein